MKIRLHPATPHADVIHKLEVIRAYAMANVTDAVRLGGKPDPRLHRTWCGILFAEGDWRGPKGQLPLCKKCWSGFTTVR